MPIFLLVIVALNQIWLSYNDNLSPWSGGGFGMFSTTDAGGNRHLHALAIRPGIRRVLEIPVSLKDKVRSTLTFPNESNLRALAIELADFPTPDEGPLNSIVIQVWSTSYDQNTLEPSTNILNSKEVPFVEQ